MNTVDIRSFKGADDVPTLILVDPQREYVSAHRPLSLTNYQTAVRNCKRLLEVARSHNVPVAFVRWSQRGTVFNHNGQFAEWVEGLTPAGSDMIFERQWPSCYACPEFYDMMNDGAGRHAIIAGFTGSIACLATIIEGISNQHRFTFVCDASASHAHGKKTENETHEIATFLISSFAEVETTNSIVHRLSTPRSKLFQSIGGGHAIG